MWEGDSRERTFDLTNERLIMSHFGKGMPTNLPTKEEAPFKNE